MSIQKIRLIRKPNESQLADKHMKMQSNYIEEITVLLVPIRDEHLSKPASPDRTFFHASSACSQKVATSHWNKWAWPATTSLASTGPSVPRRPAAASARTSLFRATSILALSTLPRYGPTLVTRMSQRFVTRTTHRLNRPLLERKFSGNGRLSADQLLERLHVDIERISSWLSHEKFSDLICS